MAWNSVAGVFLAARRVVRGRWRRVVKGGFDTRLPCFFLLFFFLNKNFFLFFLNEKSWH